ncbi:MAG: hypothetical protein WBO77_00860 [Microgenomates group bacterium]
MKLLGYIFIAIGFGILVFVSYVFFTKDNGLVSPVPDAGGVKVIQLSPAP